MMGLKEVLKLKEIKQECLAKELGVDQTAVSKWCQGLNAPRVSIMLKLRAILRMSGDEILEMFGGDGNGN